MSDVWPIVFLTLKIALTGIAWSAPLALGLAYLLARKRFWGRGVLSGILLLPLVLPPVVTGFVLLDLFGPKGLIGAPLSQIGIVLGFHWTGAALVAGLVALPLMVRPMRVALEAVDPEILEVASLDGANRWQRFWQIDARLAGSGIVAGLMLGFAKALGEFGATITFVANIPGETRTLSLAIFTALQSSDGMMMVYVLSAFSVALSLTAAIFSEILVERLTPSKWDVKS